MVKTLLKALLKYEITPVGLGMESIVSQLHSNGADNGENKILHLNPALYPLTQAPWGAGLQKTDTLIVKIEEKVLRN